jgi:hypothetical protein
MPRGRVVAFFSRNLTASPTVKILDASRQKCRNRIPAQGHYYLNDIKAVGAEVINEARAIDHFIGINSKLFNHDLSNSFSNLAHLSSPIPHFLPGAAGVKSTVQRRFHLPRSVGTAAIFSLAPAWRVWKGRKGSGAAPSFRLQRLPVILVH